MLSASLRLRHRFLPGILAFVGLLLAGCFNGPGNFKCTDGTHCPTGYSCVGATATAPGLCQMIPAGDGGGPAILDGAPGIDGLRGVDGAFSVDGTAPPIDGLAQVIDAPAAVELGSVADASALPDVVSDNSASPDSGPDQVSDVANDLPVATPDAPPNVGPEAGSDLGPDLAQLKGQGAPCFSASDCQGTLVCADNVCCNQACTGCNACSAALNGQKDGTCLPVPAGQSAHNACTASGTPCGLGGTCDGAGSCRFSARGTACGSTCSGSTLTSKACDGAGTCAAGTPKSCSGSLTCADGTSCKSTCASNTDCVTGNCTANGTCGAQKLADGATCSATLDCASGLCVDGVCCNAACGGQCQACDVAGSIGTCSTVNGGAPHGSRTACTGTGTCGGTCNGSSATACNYPTSLCASQTCDNLNNSLRAAMYCSGGTCSSGGAFTQCPTGCSGAACLPLLTNGSSCTIGTQCSSGYCTGKHCCSSSTCVGTCASGDCQIPAGQSCCTDPGCPSCVSGATCNPFSGGGYICS